MRRAALLALLIAFVPTAVHAQALPDVRIVEVLPNPDPALGQREFIELLNAGSTSVDLAGWKLRDAPTASNSTNEFTFGPLVLGPGQRVVVWSNGTGDAYGPSWSNSASKAVWNDAGDAATLLEPQGTVRDWVAYGSTTQAAPDGITFTKPAAPVRGKSVQLADGAWSAADPTPALAPGQTGGAVAVRVANVAPQVTLQVASSVRVSSAVTVHLEVSDGNGADDLVGWSLSARGQVVHQGNGSFAGDLVVTAPAQGGPWSLSATATDLGGLAGNASATVAVRQLRISVALPPGGALRFPDLRPGDHNVTSLDAMTLRNDGEDPARPLIDISPLRAGAARIDVERNLWLGLTVDGQTTWSRYDAPLQALPTLAPGQAASLALRIGDVPLPAAAGLYGTTFTVVAT